MRTLHLTLHRKWFDEIAAGTKTEEYRDITPYWKSRLFNPDGTPKQFDRVVFRNGYSRASPRMEVEFLGVEITDFYVIRLGKVLQSANY